VLYRLPAGDVREEWSAISGEQLRILVEGLRGQDFCGYVELRWPDCEGALILSGEGQVFAVFQADAVDLRGPEALRHITSRMARVQPRARVVALPYTLGPLLGALSELQPLHMGLHTRFVDLERLSARLVRDGLSGLMVLEGDGWWGFLPFGEEGNGAVYYDGRTVMGEDRTKLIESLVGLGAQVEVWVRSSPAAQPVEFECPAEVQEHSAPAPAPTPVEPGWQAYRGSETFVAIPALVEPPGPGGALQELRDRFGELGVELARRLDGTRTLEEVQTELGRSCAELEPILLYLQQRKWMARYFRRRGSHR